MARCCFVVVLVNIIIAASSLGQKQLPSRTNVNAVSDYDLITSRFRSQGSGDGENVYANAVEESFYEDKYEGEDSAKSDREGIYMNENEGKSEDRGYIGVDGKESNGEGINFRSKDESLFIHESIGKSEGKAGYPGMESDESMGETTNKGGYNSSIEEGAYLSANNLNSDGEIDHGGSTTTFIEEEDYAIETRNVTEKPNLDPENDGAKTTILHENIDRPQNDGLESDFHRRVSDRQPIKRHSNEASLNAQSSGASTIDSIVDMVLRQVNGSQESHLAKESDFPTEFLYDNSSLGMHKLPQYNVTESSSVAEKFLNLSLRSNNISNEGETEALQPTTLFYLTTPTHSRTSKPSKNATNGKKRSDHTRRSSSLSETCEAELASRVPLEHDAGEDRVIDFAVIVPCNASHQYSRVKVLPVVELAVRHVRETGLRGPLANYSINVRYRDSKTSSTDGPLAAVDLYFNKAADVFLGPVDDYVLAPVARFSGRWNVPLLTPGGQPSAFDSRKDYPLLTRLKGFYTEVGRLFSSVVKHWGWNVLGIIYEENDHDKGHSVCYFTLASIYKTFDNNPHFEKFSRSTTHFDDLLIRFQDKARILVLCASPENVRRLMLAAAALNMVTSGDYAFFNVEIFSGTSANYKPWYNASDTDEINEIAKKAYEAVLTVTARTPSGDQFKNFSTHVKQIAENEFGYRYDEESVNPYVAGFFEGVLVYAAALNSTLRAGGSMKNGRDIIKHMWNRTFDANVVPPWFTGNISIDVRGDRKADYTLLDMNPRTGIFETVATYYGESESLEFTGNISWPGGRPPRDQPVCGFDGSLCPEATGPWSIVAGLLALLVVAMAVGSVFIYRHYKLEADLASMTWRISWEDVEMTEDTQRGKFGSKFSLGKISVNFFIRTLIGVIRPAYEDLCTRQLKASFVPYYVFRCLATHPSTPWWTTDKFLSGLVVTRVLQWLSRR